MYYRCRYVGHKKNACIHDLNGWFNFIAFMFTALLHYHSL